MINKIKKGGVLLAAGLAFYACSTNKIIENKDMSSNPLLMKSTLPYHAPNFKQIKNEHYRPALLHAMGLQKERVKEIARNRAKPSFENTVLALEKSGIELSRVSSVFYGLTSANTNDTLRKIQEEMSPLMAAHTDFIYLNEDLFQRIKEVYKNKDELSGEDKILTEEYYKSFVQSGAEISSDKKEKLKRINTEIASLQTEFNQTLLDVINHKKLEIYEVKELEGLSEGLLKSLKKKDGSGYEIKLINTTQQPLLSSLKNRETRKKLFELSYNRTNGGEYDTNSIIVKIAELRAEKANLLGFDTYADWSLVNTMVENKETVQNFFAQLIPSVRNKTAKEAEILKESLHEDGFTGDLEPWDWAYYAEKVRQEKYDLDENLLREYFEVNNVLEKGVFYAANKLYGITFEERKDIPVYHPDVRVFEIFEEDGTPLALFYVDLFARPSKRGGAWMSNFVAQSHLFKNKPVVYNVCNYAKPADGEPALISYDEVTTLFHEFGHALHGLFANQKYAKLSGTNVARDFVELPSQANEHWALNDEVLKNYAKHYKTGAIIPAEMIKSVKNAATFNQGFSLTEVMGAANLDLQWHNKSLSALSEIRNPLDFQKKQLEKENLYDPYIPTRYLSNFFAHIFGGGYASGYYSYLWTEMLAEDTNAWFDANGGLNRQAGQRYRDMILSQGNTKNYKEMYKAFTGRDAEVEHMIEARGLN